MKRIHSIVFSLLLISLPIISFSADPANGESLFQANCSSCHKIGAKLIGPNLVGAEERWEDRATLIKFIQNSQEVIKGGNEYAVQLYEEYNKVIMPPMALNESEVEDILAYIDQEGAPAADEPENVVADGGTISMTDGNIWNDPNFKILVAVLIILILIVLGSVGGVLRQVKVMNGEEVKEPNWNKLNATLFVVFLLLFFGGIAYELTIHLDDLRPESASAHVKEID